MAAESSVEAAVVTCQSLVEELSPGSASLRGIGDKGLIDATVHKCQGSLPALAAAALGARI